MDNSANQTLNSVDFVLIPNEGWHLKIRIQYFSINIGIEVSTASALGTLFCVVSLAKASTDVPISFWLVD